MAKTLSIDDLKKEFATREQEYLRTGILSVDLLTGGRGLPRGSFLNFYTKYGYGKTTTAFSVAKALADKGFKTIFAFTEGSQELAKAMGLLEPQYADSFLQLDIKTYNDLEKVFRVFLDSDYTVLMVDSITGCCVDALSSGETSAMEQLPATDARAQSAMFKMMQGNIKSTDKILFSISQTRANFNKGWNGPDTVAAGGQAAQFYPMINFTMDGDAQVSDIESTDSKKRIGKNGYLVSEKNRYSSPRVRIPIQILFGKGVSNVYVLLYYMYWKGLISSAGAFFKIKWNGEEVSVRGKVERNNFVKNNAETIIESFYEDSGAFYNALAEGFTTTV